MRKNLTLLAFVFATLIGLPASARDTTIPMPFVGCVNKVDIKALAALTDADDEVAFTRFLKAHACIGFKGGTSVTIGELDSKNEVARVRPRGAPGYLWIDSSMLLLAR
jgi:hypothetical protein